MIFENLQSCSGMDFAEKIGRQATIAGLMRNYITVPLRLLPTM